MIVLALVVPVFGRLRGHLVLSRAGRAFDDEERNRIELIARALSLFEPGTGPEPLLDRLALQVELAQALESRGIRVDFAIHPVRLQTIRARTDK